MPTSHTLVTVANRALDFISEFPISTLADESPYARWINRNFSHTVEDVAAVVAGLIASQPQADLLDIDAWLASMNLKRVIPQEDVDA